MHRTSDMSSRRGAASLPSHLCAKVQRQRAVPYQTAPPAIATVARGSTAQKFICSPYPDDDGIPELPPADIPTTRIDYRQGPHDPTVYPQWVDKFRPHLPWIEAVDVHREPFNGDIAAYAFQQTDFVVSSANSGLGSPEPGLLQRLREAYLDLRQHCVSAMRAPPQHILSLVPRETVDHCDAYLELLQKTVTTPRAVAEHFTRVQCGVAELRAFCRFCQDVRDFADGDSFFSKNVFRYVGAFTEDSAMFGFLYRLGVPVWLVVDQVPSEYLPRPILPAVPWMRRADKTPLDPFVLLPGVTSSRLPTARPRTFPEARGNDYGHRGQSPHPTARFRGAPGRPRASPPPRDAHGSSLSGQLHAPSPARDGRNRSRSPRRDRGRSRSPRRSRSRSPRRAPWRPPTASDSTQWDRHRPSRSRSPRPLPRYILHEGPRIPDIDPTRARSSGSGHPHPDAPRGYRAPNWHTDPNAFYETHEEKEKRNALPAFSPPPLPDHLAKIEPDRSEQRRMALCATGVKDPVPQGFFMDGMKRPQILPPLYHFFKNAKRVDVRFKEFAAFREAWYTRLVFEEEETFLGISTTTWLAKCDAQWWPWKNKRPYLVAEPQLQLGPIADPSGAMESAVAAHLQARRDQELSEKRARALADQMETSGSSQPIAEAPALPLPSTRPVPCPTRVPPSVVERTLQKSPPVTCKLEVAEDSVPGPSARMRYTQPSATNRAYPLGVWDGKRATFFEELDGGVLRETGTLRREVLKQDRGTNFEWWVDLKQRRVLAFIRRPGDLVADECDGKQAAHGVRDLIPNALIFQDANGRVMPEWEHSVTIYPVGNYESHYKFKLGSVSEGAAAPAAAAAPSRDVEMHDAASMSPTTATASRSCLPPLFASPFGPGKEPKKDEFWGHHPPLPNGIKADSFIIAGRRFPIDWLQRDDVRRFFVWEIAEATFRFELRALDIRVLQAVGKWDTLAQQRRKLWPRCWGGAEGFVPGGVVRPLQTHPQLVLRIEPVYFLIKLVQEWPRAFDIIELKTFAEENGEITLQNLRALEHAAWTVYAQTFYDYFGYTATLPLAMPPNPFLESLVVSHLPAASS